MRETFLGADEADCLGLGINGYVKLPRIPLTDRSAQVVDTAGAAVAVRLRVQGNVTDFLDDMRRRWQIGVTHP